MFSISKGTEYVYLMRIFSIGLVNMTQHGVSDQSLSRGGFLLTCFSPSSLRDFLLFSIWEPPCMNFRANTFVLSSFSTLYLIEPEVPPRNAALIVKHGDFEVDSLNRRKWVGCSFVLWVSPLKWSTLLMSLYQLKVRTVLIFNLKLP